MTDESFNRVVKVRVYATVIEQDSGAGYSYPSVSYTNGYTEFSSVQPDGSPGFRIKAKAMQVQSTVGFATVTTTLSIYNLGPDSRAVVQSKIGTKFEVFAGYNQNVKQIALGNLLLARTYKEGTDYITEVTLGDAHLAQTNGFISTSFKGQTSYQQCVDALLTALEPVGVFKGVIDVPDGGFANGQVLNGSPFEELKRICDKMSRTLNVRGQAVYILPVGQDNGNPIIEISEETGLVYIPEVRPPGIDGVPPTGVPVITTNDVSFKHLLNADLVIGQMVRIKSKFVNGEYTIGTAIMDVDSWSGPFYNECQAFKAQPGDSNG
jgi:hypothetical protein